MITPRRHLRLVDPREAELKGWITLRLCKFHEATRNYHRFKDQVLLLDEYDRVLGILPLSVFEAIEHEVINELSIKGSAPEPENPEGPFYA